MWTYLILLLVLTSKPSSYSSEFIHSIINGSLSEEWRFNFTIFAYEFQGVVVHCFDSDNRQLGITVTQGSHNDQRNIRVRFGAVYKDVPIKQFCGCDTCDGTRVNISIQSVKYVINVSCNNLNSESFIISSNNDKNSDSNQYQIPMKMVNTRNKILIMMGNIGPYDTVNNIVVPPLREQMVACLITFTYNDAQITFIGNTTRVLPSCPMMCEESFCHGGRCTEVSPTNLTCNCTLVPFNGRYCNRSLTMYRTNRINSIVKVRNNNEIYLKMTWKKLLDKIYCLMEVVSKDKSITISINNKNLLIDSDKIDDKVNKDGVNFIIVNTINNYLFIKINNKTSKIEFDWDDNSLINIGFSNNNKCESFEGAYDIEYDKSQLREAEPREIMTRYLPSITSHNTNVVINTEKNTSSGSVTPPSVSTTPTSPHTSTVLIFISLVIIAVLLLLIFLQRHRSSRNGKQTIETRNIEPVLPQTTESNAYSALNYQDINNIAVIPSEIYDYVPMGRPGSIELSPILPPRSVL